MIINQNILAILRTFLNLQKNYEKLHTKQSFISATAEFLSKIYNTKKYLMNTLIFVRRKYL